MQGQLRDSNIELYRVILMLLIVAHHYVVNSGLLDVMMGNLSSYKTLIYYILGMWGKTGINCFVLITGYYMCTSSITLRKFLKLLFEVEFYNVSIYVLFLLFGYESFTMRSAFYAVWPIQSVTDGFASCYLVFFLFIPFLNVLVRNIGQRLHGILIMLLLLVYTLMGEIPLIKVSMNYVTWFAVLYLVSSFIRLYKIETYRSPRFWGGACCFFIMIAIVSVVLLIHIDIELQKTMYPIHFVNKPNSLMALVISVLAFMYFKTIKVPYSRFINILASSSFGVLMIHANSDVMRRWLWKDILHVVDSYETDTFFIYMLFSIVAIYIVCTIIDQLRMVLFEKPILRFLNIRLSSLSRIE